MAKPQSTTYSRGLSTVEALRATDEELAILREDRVAAETEIDTSVREPSEEARLRVKSENEAKIADIDRRIELHKARRDDRYKAFLREENAADRAAQVTIDRDVAELRTALDISAAETQKLANALNAKIRVQSDGVSRIAAREAEHDGVGKPPSPEQQKETAYRERLHSKVPQPALDDDNLVPTISEPIIPESVGILRRAAAEAVAQMMNGVHV